MNFISEGSALILLAAAVLIRTPQGRYASVILTVSSIGFYAAMAPRGLPWLIGSTLGTYFAASQISRGPERRAHWVAVAATGVIVGALVLVKLPAVPVVAPLGISYFSFRLLSYLLDVYWGRSPPAEKFADFLAYVAFFPQISSGPIQRWADFSSKLRSFSAPSYPQLVSALRLILFGLFKKIVVANRLGVLVDPAFTSPGDFGPGLLILAAYAFPLQLYADFSALTDIARGASRMLGIEAPPNFDRPFSARSVQEFWSRWHMTLTSWLRDYLYSPLSAALRHLGGTGPVIAVTINMLAIGLWHGIAWNFLIFGVLNALYMGASVLLATRRRSRRPVGRPASGAQGRTSSALRMVATFHLMTAAFVFFRADHLSSAMEILAALPRLPTRLDQALRASHPVEVSAVGLIVPVLAMLGVERAVTSGWWTRHMEGGGIRTVARWGVYYTAILAILFLGRWGTPNFIYARF